MTSDPNGRYAIIPLPPGPPPPNALMIGGPLEQVLQCVPDTLARRDSIRALQAARLDAATITRAQSATRALQIAAFSDSVNTITRRLDALDKRRTQRERQYAAQQKADEQKQISDYLNTLPDPDNPNGPASFAPSGELHDIPGTDEQGDLPKELQKDVPPPGNPDKPRPMYEQPISVSLNTDDYDY